MQDAAIVVAADGHLLGRYDQATPALWSWHDIPACGLLSVTHATAVQHDGLPGLIDSARLC